jgi:ribonuclease HII
MTAQVKAKLNREKLFARYSLLAGLDEAGRGPLAGPVVAAVVMIKQPDLKRLDKLGLKDSKRLTAKKREEFYQLILANFPTGAGQCSPLTIDRINILQATFLAMKRALSDLSRHAGAGQTPDFLILDGNQTIPNISLKQKAIPKADDKIAVVSAASIIAKVTRDDLIEKLAVQYPQYGFEKHKGYGTKLHLEALERFGPCEIHRRSFRPVKRVLKKYS